MRLETLNSKLKVGFQIKKVKHFSSLNIGDLEDARGYKYVLVDNYNNAVRFSETLKEMYKILDNLNEYAFEVFEK